MRGQDKFLLNIARHYLKTTWHGGKSLNLGKQRFGFACQILHLAAVKPGRRLFNFTLHRSEQEFSTNAPWQAHGGHGEEFLKRAMPGCLVRGTDFFSLRLSNFKNDKSGPDRCGSVG